MSTFQNQNQFAQTCVLGQLDKTVWSNIMSVQINPNSVSTKLQSGQWVKIVDVAGPQIMVDEAAVTEQAWGVIIYNPRKQTYAAGDTVEIALQGSVVYLETSAAIARGAKVQAAPAGPTVATLASLNTNCMVGICLDKPTAANVLTRILVQPADPALSAY